MSYQGPWQMWRRQRYKDYPWETAWEEVAGATADTKTAALELVSQAELTSQEGNWEYGLLPVGHKPSEPTYRHRAMRPQP